MKTSSPYLRWVAAHLRGQARRARPDARQGRGPAHAVCRGHVIGQATNYGVAQIAPFVRSLRSHFDGAVTLVVDDDRDLRAFLRDHRVEAVHPNPKPGWSPHVVVSRIAAFDAILAGDPDDEPVLLTDVRDVVFQGHPLSPPPRTIEAFDEQDGQVFADHAFSRKHVGALVGGDVCHVLDSGAALCVGTIAGPAAELRRLCRIMLMLCAVPRSERGGAFGADQAAFNLAIHLNLVEADIQDNFLRVATVGVPDADRTTIVGDGIRNPDGSVSPIVHQYDRHPHLVRHVNEQWGVTAGIRPVRPPGDLASRASRLNASVRKRIAEAR